MAWTSSISTRATSYDVLASDWNTLVNNLNFLAEVNYAEITSGSSSSATTVGTAVQVVTLGAQTYLNAPHLIEFYVPRFTASGSNTTYLILRDGATVIGAMGDLATSASPSPLYLARRLTPTAASHTYNVACWVVAGTASWACGSGGTAGDSTARLPAWIRATPIPT